MFKFYTNELIILFFTPFATDPKILIHNDQQQIGGVRASLMEKTYWNLYTVIYFPLHYVPELIKPVF